MLHKFTQANDYRLPTTSEEILGIYLKEPQLFKEYKRKLSPGMFKGYAGLYTKMLELDEQDSFTFKDIVLTEPNQAESMHRLRNGVASTGRLPGLIEKLKEEHLGEQIHGIVSQANYELITQGRNPNELLPEIQEKIQALINTESTDLHDPGADVDEFYQWIDEIIADPAKAYGMMTGLEDLDALTTGFYKGDFAVVGARTSIGKSAFMIEIALRFAKNGRSVAIYSLEMSKRQIYLRMMANLMSLDLGSLKTGRIPGNRREEMEKHKQFLKSIYVDDTRAISADYITDSMRRVKRTRGLDVVMVDYLQDVKEAGEQNDNGGSALGRVCRKLRKGAQEFDCAMIGISQVTRGVEERKDKRPLASDLAGSTGIETSADVIAMLYREDYYDPDCEEKKKNVMEINFCKQRNGQVGKVELYYAKRFQQLRPISTGRY